MRAQRKERALPIEKTGLPIDAALSPLKAALGAGGAAVLEAPPGAGKTTIVPLALMDEPWLKGQKILMLEPRRLAARAAAARMAALLGEAVGERVGYRIRLDAKVGPRTRIEVLTEGLLTRRLQSDPALEGVGLVIFDEFHERGLNADLGLALAIECQQALNENMRLLVMSATLDGAAIARLLGGAPIIRSEGRAYPVETRYRPLSPNTRLEQNVAATIRAALRETQGGILVFLPGEGEIRNTGRLLEAEGLPEGTRLWPLYGALTQEAQDGAIRPAPRGERKIVLSTAIAETSLTIEDIRVVIDSGQQRLPRFDPSTGMTHLFTQRLSAASAEQRRGRAGRVAPGVCYRLWSEPETRALLPFTPPEILAADLAPLALDLALWGVSDPSRLAFLNQPPAPPFAEAKALLRRLEALDEEGRITGHGRAMAGFGAHPRLAHMMLKGKALDEGATACALAAILQERDVVKAARGARDADLRLRLEVMANEASLMPGVTADRGALARAREQARAWRRTLRIADVAIDITAAGRLAALAFPDRVAQRRGQGSFRLANGRGATIAEADPLAGEPYLAIAAIEGGEANARIHLAAPLLEAEIDERFATAIRTETEIAWDERQGAVLARERDRLGALTLRERPIQKPPREAVASALLQGLRRAGIKALPWTQELENFRARIAFARRIAGEDTLPDFSDAALLGSLEDWLAPFLGAATRLSDLQRLDLSGALHARLDYGANQLLSRLAPTHVRVPSGSNIPIDYAHETPVLAVRLQEMFGLKETPRIGNGKVPLLLHLLSPAHRPVQTTRDIAGFWASSYQDVKKDLKGRYPKHYWPDNPLEAAPTARAKPRGT
ncbi:MAG: ATP-dependent helicase HrpB [Alphaproteobacteria bacterium]|nr:ATP-dependent helicase HrpB [Alphaproteobacteria bacterium]